MIIGLLRHYDTRRNINTNTNNNDNNMEDIMFSPNNKNNLEALIHMLCHQPSMVFVIDSLVSLFNGISNFLGYLMPKLFS